MKKSFAACFVALCLLFTVSPAFATTLFGPQQFIRVKGSTTTYNETFSATPGPARIYIQNGEVVGEDRVDNVVSSARVYVNGEEIFSPNNFKKHIYVLEDLVQLNAGDNTITVEINGKPGTFFTLRMTRPGVTFSADPDTITSGASSLLSWSADNASYCVIEPGLGTHGTSGTVSVSPAESTTYTVTAIDSQNNVTSAGTTVQVNSGNQPPVATPLNITTTEDTPLAVTLSGTDPENDSLTYQLTSNPNHGALSGASPFFSYIPSQDFHGSDSFTFIANDGIGNSQPATIVITVTPVNDAPFAGDDHISTDEDTVLTVATLLDNDTDVDGDILAMGSFTQPDHGALADNGISLTYTPVANFNGFDSFTYSVIDNNGGTSSATVSLSVNAVNDSPIADEQSHESTEDTPLSILLTGSDIDSDPLTYSVTSGPTHGTLSGSAPGQTYTPDQDYHGPDSFTYTTNDGTSDSAPATISILIAPVNDAPVTIAGPNQIVNRLETVFLDGGQSYDIDGDQLNFQWSLASLPAGSTTSITSNNQQYASFVPDVVGEYVVVLDVHDGNINGPADTLVVTVLQQITTVPDLQGMTQIQAEAALTEAGLNLGSVTSEYSNTIPSGSVISQTPTANSTVEENSSVSIVLSLGPTPQLTATITANPETITLGQQVTLEWSTSNAETVSIDQGIGSVQASGTLIIYPLETTDYTLTAMGLGGEISSTARVTVISPSILAVQIDSPVDESLLDAAKVTVRGTVTMDGNEAGVTVNGQPAIISGNQFVSNNVPLVEGENTITADVTDAQGNTASDSIVVHVPIGLPSDSIQILSNISAGLAPLKIQLNIRGTMDLTGHSLVHAGPGEVEYLENEDENEYTVQMATAGIYYFTAEVTDGVTTYTDTVAVAVLTPEEILVPIQEKWDSMKESLLGGNIEAALTYFVEANREKYRAIFTGMTSEKINRLFSTINDVGLQSFTDHVAYCGVIREEAGVAYSYPVTFVKDEHGIWKIMDL